jgi:hypothetical protein
MLDLRSGNLLSNPKNVALRLISCVNNSEKTLLSTAKFNFAIFFVFVVDFSFALYPVQRYLQVK